MKAASGKASILCLLLLSFTYLTYCLLTPRYINQVFGMEANFGPLGNMGKLMHSPGMEPNFGPLCNMSKLMQSPSFYHKVNWTSNFSSLSVENCTLDAIDAKTARGCLSRSSPRGIMLVGDSVTRYQYLNLIYFLVHNSWQMDGPLPNENQKKFESWDQYYKVTNQRMNGHEICDCYRKRTDGNIDPIFENRYFDDGEVKVSYRQVFGNQTRIRMHDTDLLNLSSCRHAHSCKQGLCSPGECSDSVPNATDFGTILQPGTFQSLAQSQPASDIFFNAGLWWPKNGHSGFADHHKLLIDEALRFRAAGNGARLHWKATTAARGHLRMVREVGLTQNLIGSGAFDAVFDAWALTTDIRDRAPKLMWDDAHFESAVYGWMNRALIAYICSLPPGR
jgi:hypothetical protein